MAQTMQIVSMLVTDAGVTLFTNTGLVIDYRNNGPYDTLKIVNFLKDKLTGSNVVEFNPQDFTVYQNISDNDMKDEGYEVTLHIKGEEIQGVFYPNKVNVEITVDDEVVSIPNVEKLHNHLKRAQNEQSPSVRNFLRRMAKVARDRRHSAEDLMDFIEMSELPLTNDGCIIAYKKVNQRGSDFVDVHSGNIMQRLGSRVWMEVDMVDPSRRNSCSTGLHVANLGYLKSFPGSHILVVLVKPENFIAVPYGETHKCRVSEYDVIGIVPAKAAESINQGNYASDPALQRIISAAITGNHADPIEAIKVGDKEILERLPIIDGEVVQIPLEKPSQEAPKPSGKSLKEDVKESKEIIKTMTSKEAWRNAPKEVITAFIELKKGFKSNALIAKEAGVSPRTLGRWRERYDYDGYEAHVNSPKEKPVRTIKEEARHLYQLGSFIALKVFKREKKKSWNALGFSDIEVGIIEASS